MILAELITNSFKHAVPAGGRRCHVEIAATSGGGLRIAVEDDGPGFDPDAVGGGTGLREARGLLDDLGGRLQVERLESGVRIVVRVPGVHHDG